jgi:hypothetical protein
VQDKSPKKNLKLVMVYGPAHEDRRELFLTKLVEICSTIKIPTLIGGDFNILRFSNEKTKTLSATDLLTCSTGLLIHTSSNIYP